MKKTVKYLNLLICCFALAMVLQSCEEQGPAEKAGEKVDSVMEQAKDKMAEAGDKIKETAEEVSEELEDAAADSTD